IRLDYGSGPVKGFGAWNELKCQDQVFPAVDGQYAIKVFIAAGGKVSLVVVLAGISRWAKPLIKSADRACYYSFIFAAVIVMITNRQKVRNCGSIKRPEGDIRIALLLQGGAIVNDVTQPKHCLDIQAGAVIGDPLRLAVQNLREELRLILRVGQQNNGKIRRRNGLRM